MSQPGTSLRDQGIQALREGRIDQAVDLLARAVMADDKDAEAKALLGVAYSQKGLHQQAVRALTTAVELQGKNPMFRFNLGIALERAGDTAGAAYAFRDTVQLSPDHAQAKGKLQAMGAQGAQFLAGPRPNSAGPNPFPAPPAPAVPGVAPMPPAGAAPMPPPAFAPPGAAAPPSFAPPGAAAPPPFAPPGAAAAPPFAPPGAAPGVPPAAPSFAPPPMPNAGAATVVGAPMAPPMPPLAVPGAVPGYGAPPGMNGGGMDAPPGTVQCPGCGQFSKIGMVCEYCSTPLPPPPRPAAPASFAPTYTPLPGAVSSNDNYFDMSNGEAFFRRFVAYLIDNVLVFGLSFGVGVLFGVLGAAQGRGEDPSYGFMAQGAGIVIQWGYFGGLMSATGATLGKMAMGLKVTGPDGGNPGFFRAGFREGIGKTISSIVCLLGFFWMLWDDSQETWHDKLFGTSVIRVR